MTGAAEAETRRETILPWGVTIRCSSARFRLQHMEADTAPTDSPVPPGIALFDLDGTLIAWDCQLLFRHFVIRREPWRACLLPVFLVVLPLAPLLGKDLLKRVFLSYLVGIDEARLAEHSREFARQVAASVFPEVLAELRQHQAEGDFTVLTSASPECYVAEIGRELGFDRSFGTRFSPGPLIPVLTNHKGAEKVNRLRKALPKQWFDGPHLKNTHGYTDSAADLPMLALCRQVTLINPKPELMEQGKRHSWRVLQPARPWSGSFDHAVRSLKLLLGLGKNPGAMAHPEPKA